MDYEVVSDTLRRKRPHRGRPTPEYILALLEGKTLRVPRYNGVTVRTIAKKEGFVAHMYKATDEAGGYIVWFARQAVSNG